MARTPKGYTIYPGLGQKGLQIGGGADVIGDATDAEIELWEIREELIKGLKAAQLTFKGELSYRLGREAIERALKTAGEE